VTPLATLLPPPRPGLVRGAIAYGVSVALVFTSIGAFFGILIALGAP